LPRGIRLPIQLTERKHGPVAIHFARSDPPATRFREIAGTVTVQTFSLETIGTIRKPAAAIGRVVKGGGGSASLISWTPQPGNEVRVVAEMQLPYGSRLEHPVAGPIGFGGRRFGRRFGGFQFEDVEPSALGGDEYQGMTIQDAAGRRFTAAMGFTQIVGLMPQYYTVHVTATYRPPALGAAPDRIDFAVRRPMAIDVPFRLCDVPLP
jgi:hypothetical protein